MKFKNYLEESNTMNATNYEASIVNSWNIGQSENQDIENIINFLKESGVSKTLKATHLGSANLSLSDTWIKNGGKDKTPKTDLKIGPYTISLKVGGSSQLMSGSKNETLATFLSVAETFNSSNLIESIVSNLQKMTTSGLTTIGSVEQDIKTGQEEISKANQINIDLTNQIRKFFSDNKEFTNLFIKEAMSGEIKFGKDTDGHAKWILATSKDGMKNSFHRTDEMSYISRVSNAVKMNISFKSSSQKLKVDGSVEKTGKYRYWSVMRLLVSKVKESQEQHGELLNEGIISSIINWFKGILQNVKKFLQKSIKNVFDFFELVPEVKFNNKVNFNI